MEWDVINGYGRYGAVMAEKTHKSYTQDICIALISHELRNLGLLTFPRSSELHLLLLVWRGDTCDGRNVEDAWCCGVLDFYSFIWGDGAIWPIFFNLVATKTTNLMVMYIIPMRLATVNRHNLAWVVFVCGFKFHVLCRSMSWPEVQNVHSLV